MESIACAEALPYEILAEVFSYLTFDDVTHSVQYVCSRWKEVVRQSNYVWTNKIYRPYPGDSDAKIVNVLKQAPRLQTLILDQTEVGSVVPEAITHNCHHVKKLVFHDKQKLITSDLINLVRKCPNIVYLSIPHNVLWSKEQHEIVGQFINITTLKVSECLRSQYNKGRVLLSGIADGCSNLQHMYLINNFFTSEELAYFLQKKGSQLRTLSIDFFSDRKCIAPFLSVCTGLKTLHLCCFQPYRMQIGSQLQALWSLRHMTCLTLSELLHADINDVVSVFKNEAMNQLEKLYIGKFYKYEDRLADVIVDNCPRLKLLGFKDCDVTDRSVERFHSLSELQGVSIRYDYCPINYEVGKSHIHDTGMSYIRKCKNLRYIELGLCRNITEESMKHMGDFRDLRTLKLSSCDVKGLLLGLISLKHLTLLSMVSCRNVDKEGVAKLHCEMPHLTIHVSDYTVHYWKREPSFEDDPVLQS